MVPHLRDRRGVREMSVESQIRDLETRIVRLETALHNLIHILRAVIDQLDYVESSRTYVSQRLRDELATARANLADIMREI